MIRYGCHRIGGKWVPTIYRPGFGWTSGSADCLQDAYAWIFKRIDAAREAPNSFDNHAISGAKEEA